MSAKLKSLVIVVTGTMTSGKAALKYFLVDRGFKYIRHTDPILQEGLAQKKDMKKRENWIKVLVEMRKKKGMDILGKMASRRIRSSERYVICPVRTPSDIEYFKEKYNAIVLFIDAPFETRYKRTFLKELGSSLTKAEFKKKDEKENNPKGKDKEYLPNINECKKLSDIVLNNNSTLNALNKKLEDFLRRRNIPDLIDTGAYEDFEM